MFHYFKEIPLHSVPTNEQNEKNQESVEEKQEAFHSYDYFKPIPLEEMK